MTIYDDNSYVVTIRYNMINPYFFHPLHQVIEYGNLEILLNII